MYVSYLKSGALPVKSSRPESAESPEMGKLRERIRLVHELGEPASREKVMHNACDKLGVYKIMRHRLIHLINAHSFFGYPLDPCHRYPHLVRELFADAPYTPVAQVVYVVHRFNPLFDIQKLFYRADKYIAVQ